jgi:type VI secretion system protein ImpF
MASNIRQHLQPTLLDRLTDDERAVVLLRLRIDQEKMSELSVELPDLVEALRKRGLRTAETDASSARELVVNCVAVGGVATLGQLGDITVMPKRLARRVRLKEFCAIQSGPADGARHEAPDRYAFSMRRLRECVQRDLGWLLNAGGLDTTQDISRYSEVARSVLNYGIGNFAGKTVPTVDPNGLAQRIQGAIAYFEPRLRKLQVTYEPAPGEEEATMAFRIEAELWGQPMPQQLILRTKVDFEAGAVTLDEAG